MQRKLYSLTESITGTLIGSGVALVSQFVIFPWFNIHISLQENLWIAGWFTLISVARSYLMRRLFNWIHSNTRWH